MWYRSSMLLNHRYRFHKKLWKTITLNILDDIYSYSTSTKGKLMRTIIPPMKTGGSKVTIVGVGRVGMATSFGILSQKVTTELCLVDSNADKLSGETLDLLHGALFLGHCKITKCVEENYAETAGSRLCIITAGERPKAGDGHVKRNVEIIKIVVPKLVKHSPNTILLIVASPVDILTYFAWKVSGFPKERVIGTGTDLDTARFRFLLSNKLRVAPQSCYGWIIGEHGERSIVVWPSVNVAGARLIDVNTKLGTTDDPENWSDVHKQVIHSGRKVIKLKGYTSWAVGITVSAVTASILNSIDNVHALSTMVKGYHGITQEVFFSLPVIIGNNGITDVVKQTLSNQELQKLHKTAKRLSERISTIQI